MLLSFLASCAIALGAADHPAHHPADVDLYLEAPDVQAIVQSYAGAPLVKMLGDEATAKIGAVASTLGLDMNSMFDGVLPKPDPAHPGDRFWPWSATTRMSISVSGLDAAPATGAGEARSTSGWFVVDFKDAAAAGQALAAIGASGQVTKVAVKGDERLAYDGHELELARFELPFGTPHATIWCAQSGARLVGGIGSARPSDLATRLSKPETSFVEKAKLLADDSGFTLSSGVTIVRAWSDLERLPVGEDGGSAVATLANEVVPEVLPFVGSKGRWRLQLRKDRFVSESLSTRIGPAKQLDAFFGEGSMSPSVAHFVPKEAVGVWLVKLKPEHIEKDLSRLLSSATARGEGGAKLEAATGDAPSIASAMGDSAAVFLMPLSLTGLQNLAGQNQQLPVDVGVAIELKDATACQKALEAWIERAKKADAKLAVEAKPYHKMPTYTFSYGGAASSEETPDAARPGGLESLIHPTIVILSDRLLVTSSRTLAQKETRRIESKPTDAHAIASDTRIPKDAFEASTMDWVTMLGKLYDAGRGFLPMMFQNSEKHIDVESLPTAAQLFRFFQPSFSYSKRVDGRIYTYSESSFGPETPLAIGALGFLVSSHAAGGARTAITAKETPVGEKPVTEKKDSPITPHVDEAKKSTLEALRAVKTGLAVYKSQAGHYPAALDELLKGSDNFPQGYLEGGVVPKDGWGHALVYAAQEKGAKYELRSCGPDGVDQKGAGDDVNAP